MNYRRHAAVRREHRRYNAIFGAVATLALVGGGYIASLVIGLIFRLLGVA